MHAYSALTTSVEDVRNFILECKEKDFHPTLAFVFLSDQGHARELITVMNEFDISLFGASSGGSFDGYGEMKENAIGVLLLDMDRSAFMIETAGLQKDRIFETCKEIGRSALTHFRKPAFIVSAGDPLILADNIIEGLESAVGTDVNIFGGIASDYLKLDNTFIFTNQGLQVEAMSFLIIDEEKVSIHGIAYGGWRPMGLPRVITKSEGNVVYEIDHEPALDFLIRYSGEEFATGDLVITPRINFQLQVQREGKTPVMRTPMYANAEDRTVTFAGALPQGSIVRLCLLPGYEVIQNSIGEFKNFRENNPHPDALLLFSCKAREMALGEEIFEEVKRIRAIWDVPLSGFFSYGEIGKSAEGFNGYHNMMCSLVLLKEVE